MPLSLIPVTSENMTIYAALSVAPAQAHLIADNVEWLDELLGEDGVQSYGIQNGVKPVGLVSILDPRELSEEPDEDDEDGEPLSDWTQAGCGYVVRFMIDGTQQARGTGSAALALICDHIRSQGHTGVSLTTMDYADGNALGFYERHGFAPTGRRVHGEIELIKTFDPS